MFAFAGEWWVKLNAAPSLSGNQMRRVMNSSMQLHTIAVLHACTVVSIEVQWSLRYRTIITARLRFGLHVDGARTVIE